MNNPHDKSKYLDALNVLKDHILNKGSSLFVESSNLFFSNYLKPSSKIEPDKITEPR